MQTDKSLGALGVFASLAGLVVFIFMFYNIYLIATGVTTNESFKWEDIGEMIYRKELVEVIETDAAGKQIGPKRYEQRDRRHPSHPRYVGPSVQEQPSPKQALSSRQIIEVEKVIGKMREIDNIYDQGVVANIRSIVFPPNLDKPIAKPSSIASKVAKSTSSKNNRKNK